MYITKSVSVKVMRPYVGNQKIYGWWMYIGIGAPYSHKCKAGQLHPCPRKMYSKLLQMNTISSEFLLCPTRVIIIIMVYWSLGKIHYIIDSKCKEEGSLIRLINPRTVNYLFVHYEKDDGFDCNLWITSIEKPFPPIRRNNSKRTFDQNRRKYKIWTLISTWHDTNNLWTYIEQRI